MNAQTTAARPSAESTAPPPSSRAGSGAPAGTNFKVINNPTVASTTFSAKTDGQSNHSSSTPETSRPSIADPPATPAHAPTALSRAPSANVAVMTDSVVGMINAAPMP